MIEETFHLHPPDWLTDTPRPKSTALFRNYVKQAPDLWPKNTSTYQGFYIMGPDGAYLEGNFGIAREQEAKEQMQAALVKWKATGAAMRAVPATPIAIYGGKEPQPGAVKLQLAYRDLPRGDLERPSTAYVQNPYNLGWFDLSKQEAQAFLSQSQEPAPIPTRLVHKLATTKLKDAVQGQMRSWSKDSLKEGSLTTQLVSENANQSTYRLQGSVDLQEEGRRYQAQLHGKIVYDLRKNTFTAFDLIASGQRTGKGGANGRATDPGPAPMGIAFKLFPTPQD